MQIAEAEKDEWQGEANRILKDVDYPKMSIVVESLK